MNISYLIDNIKVELGDIINFHGSFPILAPAVRFVTRSKEGHSAGITDISADDVMITEALTKVETSSMIKAIDKKLQFNIYRVRDWSKEERALAAKKIRLLNSTPYGYWQIIKFYKGLITDVSTANPGLEFSGDGKIKTLFCSQLIVWGYFQAAKELNKEPIIWRKGFHWSMLDPGSIGQFSEKVDCIYSGIL